MILKIGIDALEIVNMHKTVQEMVYKQQEHVNVLEKGVEDTSELVQKGYNQLKMAEISLKKAKRKRICMYIVIIIILTISAFIIFNYSFKKAKKRSDGPKKQFVWLFFFFFFFSL